MSADEQEKINVHIDPLVKPNPVENEKEIKKLTAIDFWYYYLHYIQYMEFFLFIIL